MEVTQIDADAEPLGPVDRSASSSLLDVISSYFRLTGLCQFVLIGSGTTRPAGRCLTPLGTDASLADRNLGDPIDG